MHKIVCEVSFSCIWGSPGFLFFHIRVHDFYLLFHGNSRNLFIIFMGVYKVSFLFIWGSMIFNFPFYEVTRDFTFIFGWGGPWNFIFTYIGSTLFNFLNSRPQDFIFFYTQFIEVLFLIICRST